MKLKTHFVFSIGLLTLASSFFGFSLIISAIISVLGNTLIDRLGHKEISIRYGKIPVRTPLTHTLPRSVFWGLISSMPVIIVLGLAYGMLNTKILAALIDGILVGPSHMLLDVFTENGIYVKRNGKWKRVALAHFSYDNSLINGFAIVLGVIMIFAAMELHHYYYSYYYP